MQVHTHNYEFHEFIFRQHHNRFTIIFSPIVPDTCIVLLFTNKCAHGCNDFSRLVTALHSKSRANRSLFELLTCHGTWSLFYNLRNCTFVLIGVGGHSTSNRVKWPSWPPGIRLCSCPCVFFVEESCACFPKYLSFHFQLIFYGQMALL